MRRLVFLLAMLTTLSAQAWADDLFGRDSLTGDWSGTRKSWEAAGLFLGGDEILDAFANPSGGRHQGAAFNGRLELFATADLGTAFGWDGMIAHANAYLIHGHGLSADAVGDLIAIDNIAATPATRLFTAWLQQSLFDDTVSLRLGQLAADDEFFVSQYAALFVNSAFGWPSILGVNLPSGGPAYPLATPGLRLKAALSPRLSLTLALFNGDPAPAGAGDPQRRNGDGLPLRTDGGAFAIGEIAYAAGLERGGDTLPGTYKLGLWLHDGDFRDRHFDAHGVTLADPTSSGLGALKAHDYGVYVIADQLFWRSGATSDRGLGLFLRVAAAPGDRNLIAWHFDAGVSLAGILTDSDTLGLGFSDEQIGAATRGYARDLALLSGTAMPLPDFESALELTYQLQPAPWWVLQPDLQLIFHPGGHLPATGPLPASAIVLGLRTAVSL